MSYILDALKKSEKERQRGTVPDVLTSEHVATGQTRKRRLLPYVILCVLVLGAGLLVGWLLGHPKKPSMVAHSRSPVQVQARTIKPVETAPAAVAQVSTPPSEPAKKVNSASQSPEKTAAHDIGSKKEATNVPQAVKQGQEPAAGSEQKKAAENRPVPKTTPKETRETLSSPPGQAATSRAPAEPQPAAHTDTPIKNKIYSLRELPPELQQTLPDFSISTHLYAADAASRVVRINGQMLREGEYLNPGLRLLEITPDGAIFSIYDYRFRLGLR